jgi:DNA-binding LacI/PurR family transcriptional regulator
MAGYREAMQSAGIDINPDWIARGEGSVTFGHQVMQGWLALPSERRPEAVAAFNDGMAVGAMQAIQENRLAVGVDLAVTGFDDLPMTQYLTPPLTTVRLPVAEIGERVIKMLVNSLENNSAEVQHELVEPELVVRQSSTGEKASGD